MPTLPAIGNTITPEEALDNLEGTSGGSTTIATEASPGGFGPIHSQGPHPQTSGDGSPTDGNQLSDLLGALGLTKEQLARLLGGDDGSGGSSGGGSTFDPMQAELESTYFRLWGKRAPSGVIQQALSAGLNVFQFEDQIRQDPAFRRSETYQNEMADNVLGLARMLGIFPG